MSQLLPDGYCSAKKRRTRRCGEIARETRFFAEPSAWVMLQFDAVGIAEAIGGPHQPLMMCDERPSTKKALDASAMMVKLPSWLAAAS